MKTVKMDAKYFIRKFEKIPESQWITGMLMDKTRPNCHCALGHCGLRNYNVSTEEAVALSALFSRKTSFINAITKVYEVNDNSGGSYDSAQRLLGDTPKERMLNALTLLAAGVVENFEDLTLDI